MTSYSSRYQEIFPWAERVAKDSGSAYCKWCRKSFKIDSMGQRAFTSHAKSSKHIAEENVRRTNLPVSFALKGNTSSGISSANILNTGGEPTQKEKVVGAKNADAATSMRETQEEPCSNPSPSATEVPSNVLKRYLLEGQVITSEVLWAMQAVASHSSYRKTAETVPLFSLMFPDSTIAKKISMDRTKVGYLITYGLSPYFSNNVFEKLEESSDLVLGFDESLNKIAQEEQLDVCARYWNEKKGEVESTYVTSIFLSSTKAEDLITGLKSSLQGKSNLLSKIIQLSMDGPNVNWKVMNDLSCELAAVRDSPNFSLLNIGSCGLHVVHGAFQTGMTQTGWQIAKFFEDVYYLFKDFPLRRAEYAAVTGSNLFPLKFCSVRWVENATVAERAEKMLPHLRSYVEAVTKQEEKKVKESNRTFRRSFPSVFKSTRFESISRFLKDSMLGPKIAFFISVAKCIEPFLVKYQCEAPMGPFLYNDLTSLMKQFLDRVVKPECLANKKNLSNVDLSEKDLLSPANVDLGTGTKTAIGTASNSMKVSDKNILEFRNDCRVFLKAFLVKMNQRSPLRYDFTRFISCLDPQVISTVPNIAKKRLQFCVEELAAKEHMPGHVADTVRSEFATFCDKPLVVSAMKEFRSEEQRLDTFWMHTLSEFGRNLQNLHLFVKKILILSHGNATLERGFSINAECLVVNQKKESLVAQRLVYDAVQKAGGTGKVPITKSLVHYAKNAHSRYKEALEKKRQEKADELKETERKRQAEKIIKELEIKKARVLVDAQKEAEMILEQIKELKK